MSGLITAAAIGAGSAYYGSQQSKKAANKVSKAQKPFMDFQTKTMMPYGKDRLDSSGEQFGMASNFWNKLATGGTEGYMELLGPQMAAAGNQAAAARNTALELGGGGGMSAAMAARPVMDLARDQGNAMLAMKPMAMGQLADLAAQQGALGVSAGNAGSANAMDMFRLQSNQANDQFDRDQQYGQAIAGALGAIDWGSMFGGGVGKLPTSTTGVRTGGSIASNMAASPGVASNPFTYKPVPTWSGTGVKWWG